MKAYVKPMRLPDAPKPTLPYHEPIKPPVIAHIPKKKPKKCERKRYSPEEQETIIALWKEGKNYAEIGRVVNRNRDSIRRWILHQTTEGKI